MRPVFRDSSSVTAYNINESTLLSTPFQAGGSGLTLGDELNSRKMSSGKDTSGLGRWAWTRIGGKNGFTTVLVAAYRPTNNRRDTGSVWNQHRRYFLSKGDDREPIEAFDQDLIASLRIWMEEGASVILGMDANEDVRSGTIGIQLQALGMAETVTSHHSHKSPPATQNRNRSRTPIDGIWATGNIEVIKAGYTAFGGGCPSDHRGLWVDITTASTLGHRPPRLLQPISQRLNSRDPRIWRKYCHIVAGRYQENDVPGMASQLRALRDQYKETNQVGTNQQEIIQLHNTLHALTRSIRTEAASKIRKIKRGEVPWSPRMQKLRNEIELWTRVVKLHEGKATSHTIIRRLARRCGKIPEVVASTYQEATEELKKAYQKYRAAKPDSPFWRTEHLHGLADALAEHNNSTRAAEVRKMVMVENQRRQGRTARRLRGKTTKKTVTKVTYQDPEGRTVEACDPETIATACAKSNLQRQHRCLDTPFFQPPLREALGYLADTPQADDILSGNYTPPESLDKYTKAFLQELSNVHQSITHHGLITTEISLDEHRKAWSRQKDRTASEPMGLSFSHYRSAIHDDSITEIDILLRQLPLEIGFAPQQWCNITDIEILKKANVYDVDKMRLIQLMDAEFNMNNKMIGQRMMYNAEKLGLIPQDQYGSRKNHSAVTAALNKRITMDIWRQKRQSGAIAMIDAQGCFDRIAHPAGSLTLQAFGVPRNTVRCLYGVLQNAHHRISTGFGVSDPKYGGPLQSPPVQGEGQGNGKAPATWVLVSAIIIRMMYKAGYGVKMITAITARAISFVCFAFVDDTDIIHTGPSVDTPGEIIIDQFQRAMDCWEGGLRTSGGALVPEKSFWYLIDWKWDGHKWQPKSMVETPGDITVRTTDGRAREHIRRFNLDHAELTLGIYLAMDGNEESQIRYLKGKVREFSENLRVHKASKNDAWYAMERSFLKTIEYPLTVTCITEKKWSEIMSPAINALLPKAGFSSKLPRRVLHGPTEYQGLGLRHPWYIQEITHVATLLSEVANKTPTGLLLQATTEQLQMETGLPGYLGSSTYSIFQHLATPTWIKSVWSFLSQYNMKIQVVETSISPLRVHDTYLMQSFADNGYRGNDLIRLNICRMFLKATTLADIATADGKSITSRAFEGVQANQLRPHLNWPRSPKQLAKEYWDLWKTALKKCFMVPLAGNTIKRLQKPLGDWLVEHIDLASRWQQMYSPTHRKLYTRSGLLWKISDTTGRRQGGRRTRFTFHGSLTRELPTHATMIVSTYPSGQSEVLEGELLPLPPHPSTENNHTINACAELQSLVDDASILIDEIALPADNCQQLAEGLRRGTARAVSDGSYKNSYGTAAGVIVAAPEDDDAVYFVNSVPGPPGDQSSYRSELAGILGILQMLEKVCKVWKVEEGSITIALDGKEAMTQSSLSASESPLDAGQNSFDMLVAIRTTSLLLPLQVEWKWVEGHQVEKGRQLDWWGKKNHTVDALAKKYWNTCQHRQLDNTSKPLRHEQIYILYKGNKLTRFHKDAMYTTLYGPQTLQYWNSKPNFSAESSDKIMWKEAQQALKRLPFGLQRFWVKFSTGFLGTGRKQKLRAYQDHDTCPRCGMADEDNIHVLQCQDPEAERKWRENMQTMKQTLARVRTAPTITAAILENLEAWRAGTSPHIPRTNRWGEQDAAQSQEQLGWTNFVFGRWHKNWSVAQQNYLDHHGSKTSSKRWTIAIIHKMYMTAWDLWDHRNKVLHAPGGPQTIMEARQLQADISQEYSQGLRGLRATDRHLMQTPLPALLGRTLASQRKWLQSIRLARQVEPEDDTTLGAQQLHRQQAFMAQWLRPQFTTR